MKSAVRAFLAREYPQYGKQFIVYEDTEMYEKKEDAHIWKMSKGDAPLRCDIYLKINQDRGEFVADLSSLDDANEVKTKVLAGLQRIKTMLHKEAREKGLI